MKGKRNLYLYLALICFAGILTIFVADGYLGIYDTLYITVQEREQKIESDYWQQRWAKESGYHSDAQWEEPVSFKYEIENRSFSMYSANVESSLWKSGERIIELLDENIAIAPFDKATMNWMLRPEELEEAGFSPGEYTVQITHGGVARKIVMRIRERSVYPMELPPPQLR